MPDGSLVEVLDQDLDGARLGISRRLKGLDGVLNGEAVGDELGEVQDAALEQANGAGPGVAVAVLQLDVDLADTGAHKGNADLVLADANDEDLAAKLGGPDGGGDAALDAGALHGDGGLNAAKGVDNLLAGVLGGHALDLVGDDAGAQLLGEGEAALRDVGDDERAGTGRGAAEHGDEADGACAADEDGVAELDVGALHAGEGDGEGLEQGAVLVAHVANLVAPDGRVVDVAAQQAVDGRGGQEGDALAAVVASRQAGLAGVADDVGLDGDAVAHFQRGDGRVHGNDFAGRLVAEDVVALDNHGADAACVPEVDVGAAKEQKEQVSPIARPEERGTKRVDGGSVLDLPADASGSDVNRHLALLEVGAGGDALGGRATLGHPQVMVGVCVDADVGLERLGAGDGSSVGS